MTEQMEKQETTISELKTKINGFKMSDKVLVKEMTSKIIKPDKASVTEMFFNSAKEVLNIIP